MHKVHIALLCLMLSLGLVGCITEINLPPGGYDRLDSVVLSSDYILKASPSHPVSDLPFLDLQAGAEAQIIGADTNYAWLLVLHDDLLGWMPSFMSKTGVGRVDPPVIIEPLPGCTNFLDVAFDHEETWQSFSRGSVIIQGSIYRPWSDIAFEDAWLEVEIDGAGEAVAADYVHVQLTPTSNLVLFTFVIDGLRQGSAISFFLDDPSGEPVSFQAAFFADKCDDEWTGEYEDQMPVGELKDTFPTPTPAPPSQVEETATPSSQREGPTIVVTSGVRQIGPTQQEILALVDLWDVIHHEVDYTLDPTDLPLVLTGGALRQQEQTLRTLRAGNCYWIFEDLAPSQMTGWQVISDNEVIVTMRKHWDGKLYCNGRLDRRSSFNEPFEVRYQIIRTSQGWRIAEKVPLDYQSRASAATPTPRPVPTSSSGSRQVCSGVYPTRLSVNGRAFLDGDRRNNVRSGPGTSNRIVGQIQPGESVNILDGPRCAGSMVWWYVSSSRGVVGWTSEGSADEYWLAPLGSSAVPQPATQPVSQNSRDQLRNSLLTKSRNSSVSVSYQNDATRFADALVYRLNEFQLPREGITEQSMTNALSRADAGDRMNGAVQTIWSDWLSNLSSSRLDPYQTDPGTRGMSPFRQLVVRMIQGRQGNLTAAQQRALHSLFTRPENPSVWHSNVNGVIGAINREHF